MTTTSPTALKDWPLWEVFVRSKQGLEHKHCGSLHASDAQHALQMARDVYTRRQEGVSIWVVPQVHHRQRTGRQGRAVRAGRRQDLPPPTFYDIPEEVGHM